MKKFLGYFLQGLILFIPLIITFVILLKLFNFFAGLFSFFGFSNNFFLNTLLGFSGTLLFIVFLGILASSFIFIRLFNYLEDKLEHVPFVRHIYSPIKDFTNAFVGNKKRFDKPVLVLTNPLSNIQEMGFITQEDLTDIGENEKVAVYMPLSYSLSGKLIIVPKEHIKPVKMNPTDAMKFIVSGGLTDIDK